MSVQQFCLRWNNHQPNFISVFSSLLHTEALVDVTLAAEGRQLQAHKVVLSACSSYFQSLFTSNPCQHPIVILKDVQYNDLKTMVDFMYYGEVNVSQEQLPHILKTAEMLKIKGLAEMPDPATLTKSDSKSSSDQTEPAAPNSSGESMWGSSESQQQFHQQHQQRRSPSPTAMSPSAARRKRLRKSSTGSGSASTERTSEEHSSVEGAIGLNMSQSQLEQMSTFGPSTTNITTQNINNQKNLKESCNTEEIPPHDSSQESVDEGHQHHHHIHQNVSYFKKTEADLSGMPQQMPIDITSPTTPSDHGSSVSCPHSQPPHSEKFATMGTKRGRLLIRQPRVKRESDTYNLPSPDTEIDSSFHNRLLSVPHPKIERHASEPAPNMTVSSSHYLTVPQTPFLVKQHSHPLLLQSSGSPSSNFTLHRQLSYPTTSDSSLMLPVSSAPILSSSVATSEPTAITQFIERTYKTEELEICTESQVTSPPTIVIVSKPLAIGQENLPTIRAKNDELQRSVSSPQPTRNVSLENRSQHCPVIRPGPALGCNFCWNTIDAHGRILRRKTKYHCPECQTNLCIVPCFQEYHERQNNDRANDKSKDLPAYNLRQYPKTGSL